MSPEGPRYPPLRRNIQEGRAQLSRRTRPGQGAATISSSLAPAEVALFWYRRRQLFPPRPPGSPLWAQLLSSLLLLPSWAHWRHGQGLATPCKAVLAPLPITLCDYPPAPLPCRVSGDILPGSPPTHTLSHRQHRVAVSATAHFSGDPDRVLSCYLSPQPTDP